MMDALVNSRLCALEDIVDGGSKGFGDGTAEAFFAVRKGDQVYVYRNRCPHAGAPLNWMPDRFLDREKEFIQCTVHGALFTIEEGDCIAGPCAGDCLSPLDSEVRNGDVWIL